MRSREAGEKLGEIRRARRHDLEPASLVLLFVGGLLLPAGVWAGHRAVASMPATWPTAGYGALAAAGPILLLVGGIRLVRHLRSRHQDLWR